ncbi:MAG: DUF3501 family protein [Candidatus Acididesulfobacter guangdongensis]|uniref:DUF3501 family protein n=1 Tax=Acididesulfobacter guangdongensis TaxID=2597225 RepID=A0A519BJB1_ACIG2|nr:MAG: DUF3501 family protein [Candidatus Acididesulfobacter guangdongensis]
MRKIELKDIINIYEYEKQREQRIKDILQLKERRRIHIGDKLLITFENFQTLLFQIQEMLRVERIVSEEKIQEEIDVYNELMPQKNELSFTLFIEIPDDEERKKLITKLVGIHDFVELHITRVNHENSRNDELNKDMTNELNNNIVRRVIVIKGTADKQSALDYKTNRTQMVHFLKFHFNEDEIKQFEIGKSLIAVNHPEYNYSTVIEPQLKRELLDDLLQ